MYGSLNELKRYQYRHNVMLMTELGFEPNAHGPKAGRLTSTPVLKCSSVVLTNMMYHFEDCEDVGHP